MSWTNFTELSSYGKLSKTSKKPPSDFIDFLVAEEYLEVQGEFRSLSVTEFGQKVLDGDELVFYRKPKNLSKSKDLSTTGSPATGGALFEMLRTKRAEIAKEIGRPAFMVFSDKVLSNIAEAMPINEEQMLEVSGVGQVKFDQFGEEFLEVINQFLGEKENE
jgi:ATP-dependent DNA helicase RecQ